MGWYSLCGGRAWNHRCGGKRKSPYPIWPYLGRYRGKSAGLYTGNQLSGWWLVWWRSVCGRWQQTCEWKYLYHTVLSGPGSLWYRCGGAGCISRYWYAGKRQDYSLWDNPGLSVYHHGHGRQYNRCGTREYIRTGIFWRPVSWYVVFNIWSNRYDTGTDWEAHRRCDWNHKQCDWGSGPGSGDQLPGPLRWGTWREDCFRD